MKRIPRISFVFCWLVILSLIGSPLAEAGAALRPPAAAAAAPSPAGAQDLPADPLLAVAALVEQVYGPDEAQAEAAVQELLRRAGIPLVSIAGPVTALPDGLVLADAAIYTELVPDLVRAVRQGDFYTAEQLAILLSESELGEEALPGDVLAAGLGQWGKRPGAPVESLYAGSAVRALAGRRLQVLYRGADLETLAFDPLQVLLILAHATSEARPALPGQAQSPAHLARLVLARPVNAQNGPCDDLDAKLTPKGEVQEAIGKVTKDEIVDSWKEFALPEKAQKTLDKASAVYEKGSAVLNVLLLLLGAQIDLSDDKGGLTHFKHKEGDRSKHVQVRAKARFDSNIAKKNIACYKLAGIDVPPSGPLAGYRVRWSIDQARGVGHQGKYLAAIPADSRKIGGCGTCGEVTGQDGRSTVELYPPVEKNPEKGHELQGRVRVTANLDKDDFPFKLTDLLDLKSPGKFVASKTWDLAISAISKAGLPSKSLSIRVDYHGTEIYIARGKTNLFLFYVTAPVELDVYTCEGLNGLWKGRGGLGGDKKTVIGVAAERIAGATIPEDVSYIRDFTFQINPAAAGSMFDVSPDVKMTGMMRIDAALMRANRAVVVSGRAAQPVGEVELYMGGAPLSPLAFFGSTVYTVYRMPEDSRCPPGGYYFENYP